MDLAVTLCELDFDPYIAQLPTGLDQAMDNADLTVFLARTADQMRFSNFKAGQRYIISYALTGASLASAFGSVSYQATQRLKSVVDRAIFSAKKIDISCPAGTAFSGVINQTPEGGDASLRRVFQCSLTHPLQQVISQVALRCQAFWSEQVQNTMRPTASHLTKRFLPFLKVTHS